MTWHRQTLLHQLGSPPSRSVPSKPLTPPREETPAEAVPYLLQWLQHAVDALAGPTDQEEAAPPPDEAAGEAEAQRPARAGLRSGLLHSVLRVACGLTRALPEADAEPLGSLLPTLLSLLGVSERLPLATQLDTMEACIDCLDAARALPPHHVQPLRKKVLRALETALSHRKRRIRQAASKCANEWHMLKRQ